ncbi:MAG TPA: glycosyltransferase family A protein, partial [Acidimicrobiales bacterium]|nr:glycosyltransferase family A protein [Acidimicrobiales bacterium]
MVRDRVSVVPGCLESLEAQGLSALPTIAVIDGAPPELQASWRTRFPWAEFVFPTGPANGAESRNAVIEKVGTPLVALLDADVVGEPGWLERCCARLCETGAAIVVPLITYPQGIVHAAGNLEYETSDAGVTYLYKEHRYWGMPVVSGS